MANLGTKYIDALNLIHSTNHTKVNRLSNININHIGIIKQITDYEIGEKIENLDAGLYKVLIDGNDYIIDIYFKMSNDDYLIIKDKNNISLYIEDNKYPIIAYLYNETEIPGELYNTVNSHIDCITVIGNTKSNTPSLDKPVTIDRITQLNIKSEYESNSDEVIIPLKYSLGKLPNGAYDYIIINSEQMIVHNIINTRKEILSAGLNWQYKKEYSNNNYYVFFANKSNIKANNGSDSIRCSHFESVSYDRLKNANTNKNCIAVSNDYYNNGIWIKINKNVLDINISEDNEYIDYDSVVLDEMKKWISYQSTSENPIYIEYQLSDTIYNSIILDKEYTGNNIFTDKYYIKTWYGNNTIISIDTNLESTSCDFSVLYKSLPI